jgi:hypothetical protein
MIARVDNYITKGVQNYNDMSKKFTWFKTNFNMPVPNYMADNNPFTRYEGCWDYLGLATSYDLSGFVPGYEICVAHCIWDFYNDGGSTYNIDTYLTAKWVSHDGTTVMNYVMNNQHYSYSLPAGYYIEWWNGGNVGVASWEIHSNDDYYFKSSASGTPNVAEVSTTISFSNCPDVTPLPVGSSGYLWVEGNNLCMIGSQRFKHTMVGEFVDDSPGTDKAGFIWMDTSTDIHWVGEDGYNYKIPWKKKQFASFYGNSSTHEENAGTSKKGFIWADDEFGTTHLGYIGNDGYKYLCGAGDDPYA